METCCALTAKGVRCNKRATMGDMCGTHDNARKAAGPHKYARRQLGYKLSAQLEAINKMYEPRLGDTNLRGNEWDLIRTQRNEEFKVARQLYAEELRALIDAQQLEVQTTGVNPDVEAARRREERQVALRAVRQARLHQLMLQHRANNILEELQEFLDEDDGAVAPPQERALADFVKDPQNVHTSEAVKQTKEIVEKIRKIPVPEEYRWNMNITSKTPGEIIAECRLSAHASCQMLTQYSHNTAIYDIEEGIYGKVLDSVWQFVKSSPDKDDLCKVIKQEMEDNVGMCAQGNLSRICNIVAGYMDGVGQQESLSEKLGRLFAELSKIEDATTREDKAKAILTDNMVPADQWGAWMDAVMA